MICTAPDASPLFFISAPLCLILPKYPEVPPPILTSYLLQIESIKYFQCHHQCEIQKQLIGRPRSLPKFDHTGDARKKNLVTCSRKTCQQNQAYRELFCSFSNISFVPLHLNHLLNIQQQAKTFCCFHLSHSNFLVDVGLVVCMF